MCVEKKLQQNKTTWKKHDVIPKEFIKTISGTIFCITMLI